jgi:hypothetical protein
MEHHITSGNEPLDEAGLVAFTRCGHWWAYPIHAIAEQMRDLATAEQMHDLARFNLGIVCSFCLADFQAATRAQAWATATRVN